MKSTTAITIIPATDGFIDDLVPDAGAVIADRPALFITSSMLLTAAPR
jgi:hypothetical protein